jgi:hypothetical protein
MLRDGVLRDQYGHSGKDFGCNWGGRRMDIGVLIANLRAKKYITPLEKDILDTGNELNKVPFDMRSSLWQILSNEANHPDIFVAVSALPTTVQKPREQVTEADRRYILTKQLEFLAQKEMEAYGNV